MIEYWEGDERERGGGMGIHYFPHIGKSVIILKSFDENFVLKAKPTKKIEIKKTIFLPSLSTPPHHRCVQLVNRS